MNDLVGITERNKDGDAYNAGWPNSVESFNCDLLQFDPYGAIWRHHGLVCRLTELVFKSKRICRERKCQFGQFPNGTWKD